MHAAESIPDSELDISYDVTDLADIETYAMNQNQALHFMLAPVGHDLPDYI